jgi:hypothetical protein
VFLHLQPNNKVLCEHLPGDLLWLCGLSPRSAKVGDKKQQQGKEKCNALNYICRFPTAIDGAFGSG